MGALVGPQLSKALKTDTGGKVSVQGVSYSAGIAGDIDLGASGSPAMASLANKVLKECPNTKLVLSGYSQGALLVHNALSTGKIEGSKVAAVCVFGDPFNGQSFKGVDDSKVVRYCGSADPICDHNGQKNAGGSHLGYSKEASAAAAKVVSITNSGSATSS